MSNAGRRSMPSRSAIVRAWIEYQAEHGHLPWDNNMIDWGEPACWACSYYVTSWPEGSIKAWDKVSQLERCHVIPRALGGSYDPLNLVIMCQDCHKASPDHADPEHLYSWMRDRPNRDAFGWIPDQVAELRHILDAATRRIGEAQTKSVVEEALREYLAGASAHGASFSDGTRTALVSHIGKRLEGTN